MREAPAPSMLERSTQKTSRAPFPVPGNSQGIETMVAMSSIGSALMSACILPLSSEWNAGFDAHADTLDRLRLTVNTLRRRPTLAGAEARNAAANAAMLTDTRYSTTKSHQ
jgi:hypothetical protein